METVTNQNDALVGEPCAAARRAGMSEQEWREAIKFDSTDAGWVITVISGQDPRHQQHGGDDESDDGRTQQLFAAG